jgi:hypothetical protein
MSDIFFSAQWSTVDKTPLSCPTFFLGGKLVPVISTGNVNPEEQNVHGNGNIGPIRKAEIIHK